MNGIRLRACALAGVTLVTLACKDIPLLPQWDATWYLPVASQSTQLGAVLPPLVPAGISVQDSSLQIQVLDGVVGTTIRDSLLDASIIIDLVKPPPVSVAETLFLAASPAALGAPGAGRVDLPFGMAAAQTARTDTLTVPANGITMLHAIADAEGTLYVMRRGQVAWAGPGTLTLNATDSIGVRIALLARIAVSR